jgi:hypothetical protein
MTEGLSITDEVSLDAKLLEILAPKKTFYPVPSPEVVLKAVDLIKDSPERHNKRFLIQILEFLSHMCVETHTDPTVYYSFYQDLLKEFSDVELVNAFNSKGKKISKYISWRNWIVDGYFGRKDADDFLCRVFMTSHYPQTSKFWKDLKKHFPEGISQRLDGLIIDCYQGEPPEYSDYKILIKSKKNKDPKVLFTFIWIIYDFESSNFCQIISHNYYDALKEAPNDDEPKIFEVQNGLKIVL